MVSYSGQAGALLASTGSVDTTGNYVFAVPAHAAGASAGKTSVFWTTANGFDTMYSIWNPASQAQPLLATFQLGNGQTYLYPVTVPALGTAMIDVKEIAAMGTPDSNGNTLPLSVTQGRVSFSAASGKPTDPMNVVIGGGIYNPAKAVCGNTCETCDGCCSFQITPDPATVPAGVLTQLYVKCPWTTGALYDYTESSSWSSGNSSVVVFDSPGLASPQDPGSTTVAAQMPSVPVSQGQICTEGSLPACQYFAATPVAPVTVTPCPIPASEVSSPASNPWCTTCIGGEFMATLQNAGGAAPPNNQYNGRTVTEAIADETDGCWFSGSAFAPASLPTPSPPWPVGPTSEYGADLIGMPVAWVRYYQGAMSSGLVKYSGCSESDTQTMSIDTCGGPPTQYNSHFDAVSVTATSVSATRDTASVSGD